MTDLERVRGITIHGVQQGVRGSSLILCMDPQTGTTFAVRPGETIGAALGRVKTRYQETRRELRGGTQRVHR